MDAEARRCSTCRRWTPGSHALPGRCADGYHAWPSDACDRWEPSLGTTWAHPGWRWGGMDGMPENTEEGGGAA